MMSGRMPSTRAISSAPGNARSSKLKSTAMPALPCAGRGRRSMVSVSIFRTVGRPEPNQRGPALSLQCGQAKALHDASVVQGTALAAGIRLAVGSRGAATRLTTRLDRNLVALSTVRRKERAKWMRGRGESAGLPSGSLDRLQRWLQLSLGSGRKMASTCSAVISGKWCQSFGCSRVQSRVALRKCHFGMTVLAKSRRHC